MKTYLIILKLGLNDDSYINLIQYLKTATYWARPANNIWIIKSYNSAAQIRDGVMNKILSTDQVMVLELGKDWATYNFNKIITDWLKNNL